MIPVQWQQMITEMTQALKILTSEAPLDVKLSEFESFLERRELWLAEVNQGVWQSIDQKAKDQYSVLDDSIQASFLDLKAHLEAQIGEVNAQRQLTHVTKRANQGYMKNSPNEGGYFIDKKK